MSTFTTTPPSPAFPTKHLRASTNDSPTSFHAFTASLRQTSTQLDDILADLHLSPDESAAVLASQTYANHRTLRTHLLSQQLQLLAQDHAQHAFQILLHLTDSKNPATARLAATQILTFSGILPPPPQNAHGLHPVVAPPSTPTVSPPTTHTYTPEQSPGIAIPAARPTPLSTLARSASAALALIFVFCVLSFVLAAPRLSPAPPFPTMPLSVSEPRPLPPEVPMRRVVITGLGAISPHGIGASPFWNALLEAKSSIAPLAAFDPAAFPCQVAAVIPPFKTTDYVPKTYRKATKIMARDIELAVVAADLAVKDAKLLTKGVAGSLTPDKTEGWFKPDPTRIGCNIGAGLICADLNELSEAMTKARNPDNSLSLAKWGKSDDPNKTSGMETLTPLWLLKYLPNMLACHVSIIHDTQGPSNTLTCGQASAGLALMEATRTIQRGHADIALVGGCETKIHPMGLMRWCLLNRLNTTANDTPETACKPYDKSAAGGVLSEGGAVMVLEEYEHAKKRGATIYAEIVGLGASANAAPDPTQPDPTGEPAGVAMKKSLKSASLAPADIDLLIPPGYAIPAWDQADLAAMKYAFGPALATTPVTAARAGIGDCGAGAQALDLVAAILALHSQTLAPTANTTRPLDNLQLVLKKHSKPLTHALVLATALGGQNSSVILKRVS